MNQITGAESDHICITFHKKFSGSGLNFNSIAGQLNR